jgi:uncharacterized protein (TIGR03083 family)
MTVTDRATDTDRRPRRSRLEHTDAMRLAATEYERFGALLAGLSEEQWAAATGCPGWDVRAMASHVLAMAQMAASPRQGARQIRSARKAGGPFLDALTAHQVQTRADLTPAQITAQMAAVSPRATRSRRRTPGLVRSRRLPIPQVVGDTTESWTIGYLLDVILTRDTWMHRVDIARAAGATMRLRPEHDAVIVADIVQEWADRHGQPYSLTLTGTAGGTWAYGCGGPALELDAVDFCRCLSGREQREGLLAVAVPF